MKASVVSNAIQETMELIPELWKGRSIKGLRAKTPTEQRFMEKRDELIIALRTAGNTNPDISALFKIYNYEMDATTISYIYSTWNNQQISKKKLMERLQVSKQPELKSQSTYTDDEVVEIINERNNLRKEVADLRIKLTNRDEGYAANKLEAVRESLKTVIDLLDM